ncbi:MAG: succinate dehydrogenase/fumarate reductase iron-sulfur subunit [Gammaproteobacteria bacterium]|nr:succinate dehydrogenase/fumarate reductase iron-sulfur subunit [Gammaproteobacteria bacterium]
MSTRTIEFEILRYQPETDEEPWFQDFQIACDEDWVVLDALTHIKDHMDGSLSLRWSCHMAVCGSCGMMIDGDPKLACKTFVRDLPTHKVRIEPLANFPILRDLVVELDDFIEKTQRVKPYIIRDDKLSPEEGEYLQTPSQLAKFKQYTLCINCCCCYAACPEYASRPAFIGPAALALAHRYNQDSRDCGAQLREDVVASGEGIWDCSFADACSQVCPEHVDPAGAIQQMKISSTVSWYQDLLGLRKKTSSGETK